MGEPLTEFSVFFKTRENGLTVRTTVFARDEAHARRAVIEAFYLEPSVEVFLKKVP
jgi:hypothetical protein